MGFVIIKARLLIANTTTFNRVRGNKNTNNRKSYSTQPCHKSKSRPVTLVCIVIIVIIHYLLELHPVVVNEGLGDVQMQAVLLFL